MGAALDHVIVFCNPGAPEGDALVRAGLREGSRNAHPGQGTANRRFFFENAYLELLWVADEVEARSALASPARLWERWAGRDGECCPFGIVLRPDGTPRPPFETEPYRPPYLPPGLAIDIAVGTPLTEPAYFHLGFARPRAVGRIEPTDHDVAARSIHGIRVDRPGTEPLSDAGRALEAAGVLTFASSRPWLLELVFDRAGHDVLDLRPELPLALRF